VRPFEGSIWDPADVFHMAVTANRKYRFLRMRWLMCFLAMSLVLSGCQKPVGDPSLTGPRLLVHLRATSCCCGAYRLFSRPRGVRVALERFHLDRPAGLELLGPQARRRVKGRLFRGGPLPALPGTIEPSWRAL